MPFGDVGTGATCEMSAGLLHDDGANQAAPLMVSIAAGTCGPTGRSCSSSRRGALAVAGEMSSWIRQATTLAAAFRAAAAALPGLRAGHPRCNVHRPAVQHLDGDALPAHPAGVLDYVAAC